nr:hypothetical protein [Tanacetum cinerariifolium]
MIFVEFFCQILTKLSRATCRPGNSIQTLTKKSIRIGATSDGFLSFSDVSRATNVALENCSPVLLFLVVDPEHKYVSFVDDDTLPRHKFSLTLPMSAELHNKTMILGSSQGLFCLYGNHVGTQSYSETETSAIWNPAIRKLVDTGQLPHVDENRNVTVGFGVFPHTLDSKIVTISIPWVLTENTGTWQVEVFRLSLGAWTSLAINLPPGITLTDRSSLFLPIISTFVAVTFIVSMLIIFSVISTFVVVIFLESRLIHAFGYSTIQAFTADSLLFDIGLKSTNCFFKGHFTQ